MLRGLSFEEAQTAPWVSLNDAPEIPLLLFTGMMGPLIQQSNPDLYPAVWDVHVDPDQISSRDWSEETLD